MRTIFEAYPEALCPSFFAGQVVMMNFLSNHTGEKVRELVERRGYGPVYLPPYSPGLNSIEQAFAKMKARIGAVGDVRSAVTTQDASGFFGHCGYRALAQSL